MGWTAVTKHKTPWVFTSGQLPAFSDDVRQLYDTSTGWTQARDLSQEIPEKLHELQRLWLIEATKYNVLPLDDRFLERINADCGAESGCWIHHLGSLSFAFWESNAVKRAGASWGGVPSWADSAV